jgi:ribosomal protein S18 acetylase RimI-like enzyme
MKIREAMPDDVPGLQALWIELMDYHSHLDPAYARSEPAVTNWANYVNSKFKDESSAIFVAIDSGTLMGYVGAVVREYPPVWTIRKFGFIEEIAVTGDSRRHGIGRQLLVVSEEWLLAQGVKKIEVKIDVANKASQGLFRSQGFMDHTETLIKNYPA